MRERIQEDLHEKPQAQLPPYMVQYVVRILNKMPVNANGKVDRAALAERAKSKRTGRGQVRQQTSKAEREMQKIWGEILQIEPANIGLDDNFFEIGGNSIIPIGLVARARKAVVALGVDVFRSPTLSAMAGQIKRLLS
jgi:DNA-binding IclR family transcriptional regulator